MEGALTNLSINYA